MAPIVCPTSSKNEAITALTNLTSMVSAKALMGSIVLLGSASAQAVSQFPMSQVSLSPSRWLDNQDRTLAYLLFVDTDRLLYNFRSNHGLDTQGAETNGGWDAPDFPFRTHAQGHFMSAWAHCYAVLAEDECKNRAVYMVEELAKCQANNDEAGFSEGYLSGFPESEIDKVADRTLDNGNVPFYSIHKTMAGLLDIWRYVGNDQAMEVLTNMASWVDTRTSELSEDQMQEMMQTEYGGMNDILAQLYRETNEERWITAAKRWDHRVVFDPLADGRDELDGLHANTQAQKFIGVVHEYHSTGEQRYLDIAQNAWNYVVNAHTYAIGGNSKAEHFHEPDAIAAYLDEDTCETCNTYNMLKVTRELWANEPSAHYFDYYEKALLNHLLGVQHPDSEHGHITYFTSLNPGGRRGVGPAWGGGTWSTDYDSFWCCQATSLETNTKLMDSIYWHDDSTLYVNLFIPSTVSWTEKDVTVTQNTTIPETDSTELKIEGSGSFTLRVRIPDWTNEEAHVLINGERDDSISAEPGTYANIEREWTTGDTVGVKLPMKLRQIAANDDANKVALAYGPAVLAANYGDRELQDLPVIDVDSVERVGDGGLTFQGSADGETIELDAFYNAHDYNYNVYWRLSE